MVLIDPPIAFITSRQTKAERGIDKSTANVAPGFPRKTRIMMPVRNRPIPASFSRFLVAPFTNSDWSKTTAVLSDAGISTRSLMACFMPFTIVMVLLSPLCFSTGI